MSLTRKRKVCPFCVTSHEKSERGWQAEVRLWKVSQKSLLQRHPGKKRRTHNFSTRQWNEGKAWEIQKEKLIFPQVFLSHIFSKLPVSFTPFSYFSTHTCLVPHLLSASSLFFFFFMVSFVLLHCFRWLTLPSLPCLALQSFLVSLEIPFSTLLSFFLILLHLKTFSQETLPS